MNSVAPDVHLAGSAFDTIAESYDSLFTTSMIGRSQRAAVWRKAETVFRAGDHVLELNCGTGTDALFLASLGIAVTACDASPRMIEQAQKQKAMGAPRAAVDFRVLCTERLDELPSDLRFDGVFSNFSGLNCIPDLSKIWKLLAERLRAGAQILICLSTRFCVWEILHYLCKGEFHKACRRCRGTAEATIGAKFFPRLLSNSAFSCGSRFGPCFVCVLSPALVSRFPLPIWKPGRTGTRLSCASARPSIG